jgi:hypothetical protein
MIVGLSFLDINCNRGFLFVIQRALVPDFKTHATFSLFSKETRSWSGLIFESDLFQSNRRRHELSLRRKIPSVGEDGDSILM